MSMPSHNPHSLRSCLTAAGLQRPVVDDKMCVSWGEIASGGALDDCRGRSILLVVRSQIAAASALLQLAGSAARMVLCPPDLSPGHLAFVAANADADLLLTDDAQTSLSGTERIMIPEAGFRPSQRSADTAASPEFPTEWVLLTSGTTGAPKLVVHTLGSLVGAIAARQEGAEKVVWSTFYDIRRYGGLQIFLRAALSGASLVLSSAQETPEDFLTRAAAHGVTHISGTPSHWRRALMCPSAWRLQPEYVRLSGEIADQSILDRLQLQYPKAKIAHAFASTEAGVAFEVADGRMGVPEQGIGPRLDQNADSDTAIQAEIKQGTLRVRSPRTALRYLGENAPQLRDANGFVDTGDLLELRGTRYYFAGRADGAINVGGLKVHPEEVEAVLNSHPQVSMSLVRTKKSSITGALVIAEVVLRAHASTLALERDILRYCRESLAAYKVPAALRFVPMLEVTASGKLVRRLA